MTKSISCLLNLLMIIVIGKYIFWRHYVLPNFVYPWNIDGTRCRGKPASVKKSCIIFLRYYIYLFYHVLNCGIDTIIFLYFNCILISKFIGVLHDVFIYMQYAVIVK